MKSIPMVLCGLAASLLLAASATTAEAAHVFWIDKNTEGFENPQQLGVIPTGWANFNNLGDVVTDDEQVFQGNQSVLIPTGGNAGISRTDTFHETGEYHWMFYDDMSGFTDETPGKNVRVGLTRPGDNAPRFGAIAVDTNVSRTNYNAHLGFGFTATTVERSEGWHHMNLAWDVVAGNTVVEYYIDGVLGQTLVHGGTFIPEAEFVGAPFASASGAWVDSIPEPASLGLLAWGLVGAALAARRRSA